MAAVGQAQESQARNGQSRCFVQSPRDTDQGPGAVGPVVVVEVGVAEPEEAVALEAQPELPVHRAQKQDHALAPAGTHAEVGVAEPGEEEPEVVAGEELAEVVPVAGEELAEVAVGQAEPLEHNCQAQRRKSCPEDTLGDGSLRPAS